ncbi:hypothetical protein [Streptomyces sp. URMC 123]|uniref:hypothetical protein n=1 Tax=Streptomyces sp. URMC 123 TaxID=3423403 RepID=UPI003F1CF424
MFAALPKALPDALPDAFAGTLPDSLSGFAALSRVTEDGLDWLASASPFPRSARALWDARPGTPGVLPCGTAFDVVNAPLVFGRRMVDQLWSAGPGSGPVALHRGRLMIFTAPGTAQRLPALLSWEEWGSAVPPLLCHGSGDAVTVPALDPSADPERRPGPAAPSRWLVAPDSRQPWLPGADVLLWACVHVVRATSPRPRRAAPPAQGPVLAPR